MKGELRGHEGGTPRSGLLQAVGDILRNSRDRQREGSLPQAVHQELHPGPQRSGEEEDVFRVVPRLAERGGGKGEQEICNKQVKCWYL